MKKKKTLRCMAFVICLLMLLVISVAAEQNAFTAARTYPEGGFTDVKQDAWYFKDVKSAYELSLINGMSADAFAPDSTMTVAQGITLASRIHAAYNKKEIAINPSAANWYDDYVAYAVGNGIIQKEQFDDYNREIKRYEMAVLFAGALPAEYYAEINSVTKLPDVSEKAGYYQSVLRLYHAGVIMGNDAYGTFNPNASIKRSEVAAIINRVAIPENRLKKTLLIKRNDNAYYLVDDTNYSMSYSNITSGWSYDNQGGPYKTTEIGDPIVNDISKEFGTGVIRGLTLTDKGVVTLETSITFLSSFDGFYLTFLNQDKDPTYKLYTENNAFYIQGENNSAQKLFDNDGTKTFTLRIVMNLDTKTCETIVNWVSYGTTQLLSDNIKTYKLGSTDEGIVTVKNGLTKLFVNYPVNESFDFSSLNKVPYGWTADNTTAGSQSEIIKGEYVLATNESGGKSEAKKVFDSKTGTVGFESLFFMPTKTTGFSATLSSGELSALEFSAKDGNFFANGTQLRAYSAELWYKLRFEVNLDKQTALIKVNGKEIGTVPLANAVSSLDTLKLSLENSAASQVRLDDIKIFNLVEYADYVPAPVHPAGEEKYNIGVNVCNLWRNGEHGGWDPISPFKENKPLLGYYDEGLPEVADWEIKWMVESGIDFQMICWYSTESNAPIKTTRLSAALQDGYFNAKYSDQMKFALLWEAANAVHPANSEAFRKYFVPYWVEYFFTDKRYMTIDNKLVIAVFGASQLIKDFGSAEGVKAELDYIRQVAKGLGFDGAIIIDTAGSASQTSVDCGFDGVSAYGWGKGGSDPDFNISQISSNQNKNIEHVVPTVSVGFNNVGWAGTRSPNMTVEDYMKANIWVRDVALKKYENSAENWKKNLLVLSTWNEYGEGTYISPAGLNGFGYLNVIRQVYTDEKEPITQKPTENQLSRLEYIYPTDRAIIRPLHWNTEKMPSGVLKKWNFGDMDEYGKWDWRVMTSSVVDGSVTAQSTGSDPVIVMKNSDPVDLDKITYVRVKMQAPKGNFLQIFFTTDADKAWNQTKSANTIITQDGMTEYYIKVQDIPGWGGKLDQLRIDPVAKEGVDFKIESVELLYSDDEAQTKININSLEQQFDSSVTVDNGYHMFPFNPARGISFILNLYYEWNKDASVLTLYSNHHVAVFTMGSKTVTFDGVAKELACTPYLEDGLPMLPLEYLAEIFGYEITTADNVINVIANSDAYDSLKDRIVNQWEFNLPGDTEGWTFMQATGAVTDGEIAAVSNELSGTRWDPIVMSPTISVDASKYKKIIVALKYVTNTDKPQKAGIYFKTPALGWAQARYVGLPLATSSSNGEYVVYEFDMSQNPDWNGKIDQIRFDPFDCDGSFNIDYIRVVE